MIGPERINLIHCKGHVSDEWRENYYKSGDDGVGYVRKDLHDALSAEVKRLRDALAALMDLNDNYSPFGGEMYQDRIERTWDNARAALAEDKP